MDIDADMRQRLLELVYGLLPDEEAAALRAKIATDPELARAYAEAASEARLFAKAACLEAPKIELRRPAKPAPAAEAARPKAARTNGAGRRPLVRAADWMVSLTAALLLAISVGGYLYNRGELADIAAENLRLMVVGPARLCPGVAQEYAITTTSATGEPVSAQIEFAFYAPAGERMKHQQKTDEEGRLRVAIPADRIVPGEGKIEIRATIRDKSEQVNTRVTIEPARSMTQLWLDKPLYQPGETVRYRSLTLSRFGLAADREAPVRFEILDPHGAVVRDWQSEGLTQRGVGCGQFPLAADSADGRYTLVAQSMDESFLPQKRTFLVYRGRSPRPKTTAKPAPAGQGTVEVSFYPEGGDLVAGMENRVYFAARDAAGKPVQISGSVFDSRNKSLGRIESTHEGMGTFALEPRAGQRYHLKIDKPADVRTEPKLPEPSSTYQVVLTTGLGVFEPGKPLEFNVRAAEAGLPLVAAAWCRGVPVGQQALVTDENANSVSIPLDEDVAGVIRVTVYDYRFSPPRPVGERLVYRRPMRRLDVRLTDPSPRPSPGQAVSLSAVVSDENGKPAPAALGVAVVDSALVKLAGDRTPAMPTRFLLGTEIERPEDLENADFYLSGDPKAAVALDLLLGTQGWRRFAERSLNQLRKEGRPSAELARLVAAGGETAAPAVFDNLSDLQARRQGSLALYRAKRTRTLNTLTVVSFFGGAGLVLLVAMLNLMNITSGIRLWTVSLGVAATCLILGAILMYPERWKSWNHGAVAFATFDAAPGPSAAAKPSEGKPGGAKFPVRDYAYRGKQASPGDRNGLVETLFWHPLLITDAGGRAEIRFDLPNAPATFRVTVDAHGDGGRLGAATSEIVSQRAQEKK